MNRVVVVGRLTRDVELRYTPSGHAVANFTIACNRPYKSKDGEQDVDYINGVCWRKTAENLANYMKKGSQIGVDGRLQSRSYDDKDGKKVFVTEILAEHIQFLESKGNSSNNSNSSKHSNQAPQQQQSNPFDNQGQQIDINSDDLPF